MCKKLAEVTSGTFSVAIDTTHLNELILQHTTPPPDVRDKETLTTSFVYMGFPKRVSEPVLGFAYDGHKIVSTHTAFVCPRCCTRATEIPTQCCVCGLQLNSSSHIARSYHHLFPVPLYLELDKDRSLDEVICAGCTEQLVKESLQLQCPTCCQVFCFECDIFIHDSLHTCPGCGLPPIP